MSHHIAEIPVRDAFDPKRGCPFCEMRTLLDQRFLTHVLGDAMMEPSIRIKTNEEGFCRMHYEQMLARNNRLSLALLLESHLKHLLKQPHLSQKQPAVRSLPFALGVKSRGAKPKPEPPSCYLCKRIDAAFATMLDTTLRHYEQEPDFRTLFAEQQQICLPHFQAFSDLLALHPPRDKKIAAEARRQSDHLCRQGLTLALTDVSAFCKMFDYRNAGGEFGSAREAVERAIGTLTGDTPPS